VFFIVEKFFPVICFYKVPRAVFSFEEIMLSRVCFLFFALIFVGDGVFDDEWVYRRFISFKVV